MHRVRAFDDIIVVCTVYINKCTFTLRCIIAPANGASVKGRSHTRCIAQRINAHRSVRVNGPLQYQSATGRPIGRVGYTQPASHDGISGSDCDHRTASLATRTCKLCRLLLQTQRGLCVCLSLCLSLCVCVCVCVRACVCVCVCVA